MAVTPEIEKEILALFRKNPDRFSPFKAATAVGVSTAEVLAVVDKHKDTVTQTTADVNGGDGPKRLLPFRVAQRRALGPGWDNKHPDIVQARRRFEKGTHILCSGRDGAFINLYSIPRKGKPDPRPGYFLPETS